MFSGVHSRYIDGMDKGDVIITKGSFDSIKLGFGHSEARPNLDLWLPYIKKAIEDPDIIKTDSVHADRKVYYACFVGDRDHPNMHMKVVLEKKWYGKIEVVTAYFTGEFKSGEVEIWSKN